ncbi:unnamed protein product [Rotaria magnacalcarata]
MLMCVLSRLFIDAWVYIVGRVLTSLSRSTWQAWESITVVPCLTKDRLSIYSLHRQACLNHQSFYTDPATKLQVLTRYAHLQRGKCCGNRCRHCPPIRKYVVYIRDWRPTNQQR